MAPSTRLSDDEREPVLRVEDLCVNYRVKEPKRRRRTLQAVKGVSLSVRRGETLGLVGESGCGKTTLIKSILGLTPASHGSIAVDGQDVRRTSGRELKKYRAKYQVVFQDPYSSLNPRMSIRDIVAEPLRLQHQYQPERVRELLTLVGLDSDVELRYPSDFSGGQRQRISIARALALEPSLLILDEPVSALDKSIQAQILNLLAEVQRARGVSYLLISHDLSVVRHIADTVAVMYMGSIVESGACEEVFANPAHPYTQDLVASVPVARVDRPEPAEGLLVDDDVADPLRLPSGCPLRERCRRAAPRCAEEVPTLSTWRTGSHEAACFFPG